LFQSHFEDLRIQAKTSRFGDLNIRPHKYANAITNIAIPIIHLTQDDAHICSPTAITLSLNQGFIERMCNVSAARDPDTNVIIKSTLRRA